MFSDDGGGRRRSSFLIVGRAAFNESVDSNSITFHPLLMCYSNVSNQKYCFENETDMRVTTTKILPERERERDESQYCIRDSRHSCNHVLTYIIGNTTS